MGVGDVLGRQVSSGRPPVVRRSRVLAAALVALVLGGALGSSLAWFASPQPTVETATSLAAELLPGDRSLTAVVAASLDGSGVGPTGVRATVDPPLAVAAAVDVDVDGVVADLRAAFVAHGFDDVLLVRGDGPPRVEGRRDGIVVSVSDDRLAVAPVVEWWVPASIVLLGGVGAWFSARRSARRQVAEGDRGSPRLRTTLSWAVLPLALVCTVALPLYVQPGRSADDIGDYGSLVGALVVLGAGLWVPVAAVVGVLAWVRFDWRNRRELDADVIR